VDVDADGWGCWRCMTPRLTSDRKKFFGCSKGKLCKDKWKRLYMHCTKIYRQHEWSSWAPEFSCTKWHEIYVQASQT